MAKSKATTIDNSPKPNESPTLPAPGPCSKCRATTWLYSWQQKGARHLVTCSKCGRFIGYLPHNAKTTKQQVAD